MAERKAKPTRGVVTRKSFPWVTVISVVAVISLAAVVFGYAYTQLSAKNDRQDALAAWTPSVDNRDPSNRIAGVLKGDYPAGQHVRATQRVAYEQSPPIGGAHDGTWADCSGAVYASPVRTENMVHGLEHGAVWIAYNPDRITGDALDKLSARIDGRNYSMMSPYPGLDMPISLQSWGHQLKLDGADDPRIDQFIQALRTNPNTYPEAGATCDTMGGQFDRDNPPPFDGDPPGPDAAPVTGAGENR
ncbi:DUF3105 domain-containing protein [Amycolatopsis thermoflava]|uniref:DUF3105 domain-containing protein n=1 Tax=Amycolatopsis thermoflava TaxID=84480 RepID=UPI003828D7AA